MREKVWVVTCHPEGFDNAFVFGVYRKKKKAIRDLEKSIGYKTNWTEKGDYWQGYNLITEVPGFTAIYLDKYEIDSDDGRLLIKDYIKVGLEVDERKKNSFNSFTSAINDLLSDDRR